MITAQRIAAAMGGEARGNQVNFPTPGHSAKDRGVSVTVDPSAPDGFLVSSHNGGDPIAIKRDILDRLGEQSVANEGWRVTGTYTYHDENGTPLYRTRRKEKPGEPKRFEAQRYDAGAWANGLNDTRRVLYRLPRLLAADPAECVYLVEGERKADKLIGWGFTATAVAFGCKGWRRDYAEALKGRTVVILPDRDDVGADFAQRAANDIAKAGGKATILELRGLPDKGDIIDWTGTADELRALVDAKLSAQPPSVAAELPIEYDGEIKPRLQSRHLIKGLLGTASKNVVFGPPGCGKSFLVYDWGRHVSRELDWFGKQTRPGRVAYLAAEGQAGLRNRHTAWNLAHPADKPDPFGLIPTAVDLLDPRADLPKLRATLDHFVERFGGLELFIVDTLAATFGGGDENTSDMATYAANIERLCAPYGCAYIIVHHSPLDATAKRPRGHSSLWGTMDAAFFVSGDKEAPARRVSCIKMKDDDPGPDILFKLRRVAIGADEEGDEVTSCIVEQSEFEASEVRGRRKLSAKEQIVFAALERAVIAKGRFPPGDIPDNVLNRARIGKVVAMSEWRAEALSALAEPDTKPDTARKAFDRARQQLQAYEIAGVWEEWAWIA